MSKKKEKLLQKYIDKKKKQLKRDELMAQIAQIDKENTKRVKIENKNEKSVKKKEVYEKSLDDLVYLESLKSEKNERSSDNDKESNRSDECNVDKNDDKSGSLNVDKSDDEDESFNDSKSESVSNEEVSIEEDDLLDEHVNIKNQVNPSHTRIPVDRPIQIQNQRQQLPIFFEQEEITSLIRNNQIVLIKGPTGCGKTTQIPQFIYEADLNQGGLIAVTQPRRISTVSVCSRINEELNQDLCGYQIRYDNNFKKHHKMVVMTDGILIKEIQEDFLLSKYSVIILDEVHERSCNLDILISLLSKIVKMRNEIKKGSGHKESYNKGSYDAYKVDCDKEGNNDNTVDNNEDKDNTVDNDKDVFTNPLPPLKVILMTASDTSFDLFKNFNSLKSFQVPSAPHKLSIFYEEKTPSDYVLCALNTIKRIIKKEGKLSKAILVFLPSKSDIYRLKIHLEDDKPSSSLVILPLHSSLSKKDQSLVFKDYDKIKIILSTNIAETSITIPDIKYVLDTGLVKNKYVSPQGIIKYSIEYISKSSALQRAGRAGRTTKGTCYRLYSGETYNSFLDQDIPRIQYEPLDSLILDLIALGIPDVFKFPFVTKPPVQNIEIALLNLKRLGFIKNNINTSNYILTEAGKVISKLPINPKHSHLLCIPNTTHLLPRLILLVSCLSVNFELKKTKDTEKYFKSEKSDLIVMIKMIIDYIKNPITNINNLEALKMNNFLLKKFFKGDKLKEAHKNQISDLKNEEKIELRRLFYKVFSNNLAIPNTDCYFYQNMNIYPSNSSIDPQDEFIVFEFLSQGNKKVFMKNVTIIEKEWVV